MIGYYQNCEDDGDSRSWIFLQVLYTANNFREKGRSSRSVFLFGYGDGGNGPE